MLKTLSLSGQSALTELPRSLFGLRHLETLNLNQCSQLAPLSPMLCCLGELQTLHLRHNHCATELPHTLGHLGKLKTMDLAYCENLRHLPESIGKLSQLKTLDLSGCTALRDLPASLAKLPPDCKITLPRGQEIFAKDLTHGNNFQPGQAQLPIPLDQWRADPRPHWGTQLSIFHKNSAAKPLAEWVDAVCTRSTDKPGLPLDQVKKLSELISKAEHFPEFQQKLLDFVRAKECVASPPNMAPSALRDVPSAHVFMRQQDVIHTDARNAYYMLLGFLQEKSVPLEFLNKEAENLASGDHLLSPVLKAYVHTHDGDAKRMMAKSKNFKQNIKRLVRPDQENAKREKKMQDLYLKLANALVQEAHNPPESWARRFDPGA